MQVIPSSGQWASVLVGRKLNLLDPYDNATAGVAIIRALIATSKDLDTAIAGYYQASTPSASTACTTTPNATSSRSKRVNARLARPYHASWAGPGFRRNSGPFLASIRIIGCKKLRRTT